MVSRIHDDGDDGDDFEQFENVHSDKKPVEDEQSTFTRTSERGRGRMSARDADVPDIVMLTEKEWHKKVKTRAITYLSRREYSRVDLRKKVLLSLRQFECENEMGLTILDLVLDDLAQHNWQSDARVAASIAKVKGERYGNARVKHELNQQGLDSEIIAQELEQLASTELRRAHEVWQKKFGQAPADLKEKAKQIRFLASRGFGFDVINRVIKNADDLYFDE